MMCPLLLRIILEYKVPQNEMAKHWAVTSPAPTPKKSSCVSWKPPKGLLRCLWLRDMMLLISMRPGISISGCIVCLHFLTIQVCVYPRASKTCEQCQRLAQVNLLSNKTRTPHLHFCIWAGEHNGVSVPFTWAVKTRPLSRHLKGRWSTRRPRLSASLQQKGTCDSQEEPLSSPVNTVP